MIKHELVLHNSWLINKVEILLAEVHMYALTFLKINVMIDLGLLCESHLYVG